MKKKEGKKRLSNKKEKIFFNNTFAVIALVSMVFIFTSLLGTMNPTGEVITGQQVETSFISDLFTQWSAGNLDLNIAKYLFFFMLAGLIWGALSFAKFPPNAFFQAIIALPVAFLATAYITPDEIFTILQSYTTLGIVLTFIIPFVILIFVSAMLLSNERLGHMSVPKILLELFLWIFFLVILVYKLISGMVTGQIAVTGISLPIVIMIGTFGLSLLIVVFHKGWRNAVWRMGLEIRKARSEAERQEAEEAIRTAERIERARR